MIFKTTREQALQDLENYINKEIVNYSTQRNFETSYRRGRCDRKWRSSDEETGFGGLHFFPKDNYLGI